MILVYCKIIISNTTVKSMPKAYNKYLCDQCAHGTNNKKSLAAHVRKAHPQQKPSNEKPKHRRQFCQIEGCGYTTSSGHLSKHMKSHGYPAFTAYYAKPVEMATERGCVLCHPDHRISFHNYPRHLEEQHGIRVSGSGLSKQRMAKALREADGLGMTVESSTDDTHADSCST